MFSQNTLREKGSKIQRTTHLKDAVGGGGARQHLPKKRLKKVNCKT
jgi:hypothetical protein